MCTYRSLERGNNEEDKEGSGSNSLDSLLLQGSWPVGERCCVSVALCVCRPGFCTLFSLLLGLLSFGQGLFLGYLFPHLTLSGVSLSSPLLSTGMLGIDPSGASPRLTELLRLPLRNQVLKVFLPFFLL